MTTQIEPRHDAATSSEERPRVLIVDDDAVIRMLLQDICQEYGWNVTVAATGGDALLAAGLRPPHLVLVDFHLGGGDSLQLLRDLHTVCPTAPLVVITGRLPQDVGAAVAAAGATRVVAKPCSVAEVAGLLTRYRPALLESSK